jgi:uncharacterized protein YdhG (YjbR/CyaY superfamily)
MQPARAKPDTIPQYHAAQTPKARTVLNLLRDEIERALPEAESKVWHGHPVWFLEGNPIVGYHVLKSGPGLLFWSGQSFDEPGLKSAGTFKAAEARFNARADVPVRDLRRWLKKSREIQWDYKNIVKRRGQLERIR